ncbi:Fasciclin domain protein [Tsuneonella dongtanensis]|uniref:Fasciclin domain protein n=1 Tax=Tsuneonella dongtanensis TaxID=692370 RepID=A0A1B2ACY9_9SPHN|nr:fasciclin domain-containing protein [Tsuneonella dongtanensis]ANY19984.1 Fasciclin domain protein [Tsuneonella dongtanensis]
MRSFKPIAAAAALSLLAPLAACSQAESSGDAASAEATDTLAAAIGGDNELATLSSALNEAGLADVFDGPGSYTVLAPSDDAFGEAGKTLSGEEHRAELVAVLRGHILPGHLTPDAIRKAVADKKGPVTMTTLDDGQVTFTAEGDTITVSGADGSKATVAGDALVATNGVVLPLDGLVKKVPPAPAG